MFASILVHNLSYKNTKKIEDGLRQRSFSVTIAGEGPCNQDFKRDISVIFSDNIKEISLWFIKCSTNHIPAFFIVPSMKMFLKQSGLLLCNTVCFAETSWSDEEIIERINTFAILVGCYQKDGSHLHQKVRASQKASLEAIKHINYSLELSMLDELTGVYNKRYLQNLYLKNTQSTFVCMIDIDNFKLINDTIGHISADKLLQDLVSIIKQEITPEDIIARFGGDEFVIVIHNSNMGTVESILKNIKSKLLMKYICTNIRPTISYGISQPNNRNDIMEVVDIADMMMYSSRYGNHIKTLCRL